MAENKRANGIGGKRVAPAAPKKNVINQKNVDSKRLILRERSPFLVKEAYKALRTNVAFSLPGDDCKCIAVTSSSRSEGKSYNSVNLAISFAQIGKKVILFDGDLRLPTVASKLGIKAKPGLSDYLVGEAKLEEVIRKDVYGVDVIPAGSIPPDATGLLASEEIERLIQMMRKYYDYIIVDLPPVNVVADPVILSRCIDGYVLVVRHLQTRNREVAEVLRKLRMAGAKVLGFLYNDAAVEGKRYYYRYYYSNRK